MALVARQSHNRRRCARILSELERLGVVEMTAEGAVRLRTEGFVPEQGFEEKAWYLGRNVAEHLAAAAANLDGADPPFLERAVSYGGLRDGDVSRLRSLAERLGMEALTEVNRKALAAQRRSAGKPGADRRMTLGVYFHDRDDDTETSP